MICLDTSSFIALVNGEHGRDVLEAEKALLSNSIVISPVIVTELLSDPGLDQHKIQQIGLIPVLPIIEGFWSRAGRTRSKLLYKGAKAKLADTLIAQSCIDHDVPLITRDVDFKAFGKHCGLKLVI